MQCLQKHVIQRHSRHLWKGRELSLHVTVRLHLNNIAWRRIKYDASFNQILLLFYTIVHMSVNWLENPGKMARVYDVISLRWRCRNLIKIYDFFRFWTWRHWRPAMIFMYLVAFIVTNHWYKFSRWLPLPPIRKWCSKW